MLRPRIALIVPAATLASWAGGLFVGPIRDRPYCDIHLARLSLCQSAISSRAPTSSGPVRGSGRNTTPHHGRG